ncbi:hypothetical protein QUF58_09510 [Anaerolineales bacterium HSG24]|nr:hypothetical protein [Anaerolineales bacterium HSG24]
MKRLSSFITNLLLMLISLGLTLLVLEGLVRVAGLAPPAMPNPTIWQPHPLFGWWHIPHSGGMFHSDYNEFSAEVRINDHGLRDGVIGYDNPTNALRVLSLADSFGEALQVELADTYHKQLQVRLEESLEKPVQVLNAGVGGWGTDQEAIFYVAEGFRYEPDIVLLSFFVRNDVINNYGPLETARNGGSQQKLFFELAPDGTLIAPPLEELAAVPTAEPINQLDESAPVLLPFADRLWQWSAIYRFLIPRLRDIASVVQTLGPSGILGGEGIVRAKHPTTPIPFFVYQEPPTAEFEAAWLLTESIISQLRDEVEERGAKLVVVLIAAPEQLDPAQWDDLVARNPVMAEQTWNLDWPNQRLTEFLAREDISYLDLLPIFRQASQRPDAVPLHLQHDQHWTEAGHALAAESIYEFLVRED